MAYITDKHEEGCRPLAPCRICQAVAFLRSKLDPVDLLALDKILGNEVADEKLDVRYPSS